MDDSQVTEAVRSRYAELAVVATEGGVSCCGDGVECCFGPSAYSEAELSALPQLAANVSLGCGNPTLVAQLQPGQVVLDLGSGGGIDVLLSAKRVGPAGKAYGLDMTDEMLAVARRNAAESGVENAEFLKGRIESIPLPDASVDVVISNCVINLSPDKATVISEAARVLRPGGRFAVSDVIADDDMDDETRKDMQQWTGCVAGALTRTEYLNHLHNAGLEAAEVVETHRVHPNAGSCLISAVKPG